MGSVHVERTQPLLIDIDIDACPHETVKTTGGTTLVFDAKPSIDKDRTDTCRVCARGRAQREAKEESVAGPQDVTGL